MYVLSIIKQSSNSEAQCCLRSEMKAEDVGKTVVKCSKYSMCMHEKHLVTRKGRANQKIADSFVRQQLYPVIQNKVTRWIIFCLIGVKNSTHWEKKTLLGIETSQQPTLMTSLTLLCVPPNLYQRRDNYSHYALSLTLKMQNKTAEEVNNTALLAEHFPSF